MIIWVIQIIGWGGETVETLEIQLDRVQKAIAVIESGAQSYTIGNRSLTKADLKTLYNREEQLKNAIAGDNSPDTGGVVTYFAETGTL